MERTLLIVTEHPAFGRSVMGEYRRVLTTRFPYALIYRAAADETVIVAVAHTSRRPGYWMDRESRGAAET